eukprot:m.34754 g.34754  ORF g.34754 m.34754 type:complete len:201 (+) comp17027_c0_seq1:98-700(+)
MSQPPQYAQQPPQYGSQYPPQQQQQYIQPVTTTVYTDSQPLMATTGVVYVSTPNLWMRRRRAIGCVSFFFTLFIIIVCIAALGGFHASISSCSSSTYEQQNTINPTCPYYCGTCNQQHSTSPSCSGFTARCDQSDSTDPTCIAGDCNQQYASYPRCSGGYCCQYGATGGSCSGGFCSSSLSSTACSRWNSDTESAKLKLE